MESSWVRQTNIPLMKSSASFFDQLLRPEQISILVQNAKSLSELPCISHSSETLPRHLPAEIRQFDDEIDAQDLALVQKTASKSKKAAPKLAAA